MRLPRIAAALRPQLLPFYFIVILFLAVVVPAPGISFPFAVHDDNLFFRWSYYFLDGRWLGPWDALTTSKGPLHSILTAVASRIGLNPYAYKKAFLLAASLAFVGIGMGRSPSWIRLITLATLILDPFQYSLDGLRNLRENTYIPLQLLAFGSGVFMLDSLRSAKKIGKKEITAIAVMGLSFGLMMITREARILVQVMLAIWLLLAASLLHWGRGGAETRAWIPGKRLIPLLGLILITSQGPMLLLKGMNDIAYGAPIANSVEEGLFPDLYSRISGLSSDDHNPIPRVPITRDTINLAIKESKQEQGILAEILSEVNIESWSKPGCSVYPETCGEIAGGWFQWALRDALVNVSGVRAEERGFQRLIKTALEEMDAICRNSKDLKCEDAYVGFLPKPRRWAFPDSGTEVRGAGGQILKASLLPQAYPHSAQSIDLYILEGQQKMSNEDIANLSRLGIYQHSSEALARAGKTYTLVVKTGEALKWALLSITMIAIVSQIIKNGVNGIRLLCCDRPSLWLAAGLGMHITLYTLIMVTSFPAIHYARMATPLFIALQGRICGIAFGGSPVPREAQYRGQPKT